MVLRALCLLAALLAGGWSAASAHDLLPKDHGLRYVGRDGHTPVTVEVTLRERPDGALDYVQWVTPRSWAAWFGGARVTKSRLAFRDDWLVTLRYEDQSGPRSPPRGLATGALDALAVRLRARADIARGLRRAEYLVWDGDVGLETWTLEVTGDETVRTPDGAYQSLKFRLGSETEWIEGWSAPLLLFHFVKIVLWREGKKTGELSLDDKQL